MSRVDGFGAEAFQRITGVSHETLARLETYRELLLRWQERINLIGKTTEGDVWRRHFLDSAQLVDVFGDELMPVSGEGGSGLSDLTLADMGSGAGFPGLVLAILGIPTVHLIESDGRKAAFLREAARVCGVDVTVHNRRIEALKPLNVDVVTARALAPVADLLRLGHPHLVPGGRMILLKGRNVDDELTEATKCWKMTARQWPSRSDPEGAILALADIQPMTSGR